jgi:hypothetical protein
MPDDADNKPDPSHAEILRAQRDLRLAAEMRANLLKRKALKRTRSSEDASTESANPTPSTPRPAVKTKTE